MTPLPPTSLTDTTGPAAGSQTPAALEAAAMAQWTPDKQQAFTNEFPQYSWMMSIPELVPVIAAIAENNLDQNGAQALLETTNWWKTNSQAFRQFQQLQATDPETSKEQVQMMQNTIISQANQLGIALPQATIADMAQYATALQWDTNTIHQVIVNSYQPGMATSAGVTADIANQATQLAGNYALVMSPQEMTNLQYGAVHGTIDAAGVENDFRQRAATLYPFMKPALAAGMTPKDFLSPYSSAASQLLGISPDSIQWSDPKWLSAITKPGDPTQAVSLSDFQNTLRSNTQFGWWNTQNARDTASSFEDQFGQAMGQIKR